MRAFLAHDLLGGSDAGAVDQTHQLAQTHGSFHHLAAVGFVSHVGLDEHAADFLRHLLAALFVHVSDDDLAAIGCQHARRAFAQAGSTAGHDERLALNLHVELLMSN